MMRWSRARLGTRSARAALEGSLRLIITCVCVRIHTDIHTYTYTCIHTYMHPYIHNCTFTCTCRCTCTFTCTYTHTYIPAYMRVYMLAYVYRHIYIYMNQLHDLFLIVFVHLLVCLSLTLFEDGMQTACLLGRFGAHSEHEKTVIDVLDYTARKIEAACQNILYDSHYHP